MTTPTLIAILAASLILALLLVRRLWLMAELERYGLDALYYCHRKQLSVVIADEMSLIWPTSQIILEVWHWDFSRYVVHQDHLADMKAFISEELGRKDLDLARWEVENGVIGDGSSVVDPTVAAPPTEQPAEQPPAPTTPPTPPTSPSP